MTKQQVILASKSPRRKELLLRLIPSFSIVDSTIEETYPSTLKPTQIPVYLAIKKAKNIVQNFPDALIIAADTIVCIDHQILGKPKDQEDAKKMMQCLSGRTHQVITGVCLLKGKQMCHFFCKTAVKFSKMSEEEINDYVLHADIYDKAGAYAIQKEASKFIVSIQGDYYNVVGLPIHKLYQKLKKMNVLP